MGILGLTKLLADVAPNALKENEIKNYFGKFIFHFLAFKIPLFQVEKLQSTRLWVCINFSSPFAAKAPN